MQVVHARCCGLDVHRKTVVACVLLTEERGRVQKRTRTFGTMTADLLALSDWLAELEVTQIAMESTGVYWRPVFNLLEEEGRTIVLVNAQHVKAVPGRKTDVKDSEWLADLLRHGLLRASFIPPAPIRELRELTRYRKTLVQERTQEANRLHKVLETANLKLGSVASDVLGQSGRAMLAALLGGEEDPATLAELAQGRLRAKLPELRRALSGRLLPHHRTLLARILAHIDFIDESVAQVQEAIDRCLAPFAAAVELLQTIPGVGATAAATIVAEIGTDMSRFPSSRHLASWAGLCPGNKQSAGKRLGGKPTKGDTWLRAVLGGSPGASPARGAIISPRNTTAWPVAGASTGRRWRSPTACSSSPTSCSRPANPMPTSGPTISTTSTPSASSAITSNDSSNSATRSPSRRRR